ncbi:MAG: amidase [Burkholderiaceae bacterium]|nr:amidase [Burkholderiaceae bacterium]
MPDTNPTERGPNAALPWALGDDATSVAGLIRAGTISASEALDAAIARAQTLGARLNAICNPDPDAARAVARTIDDQLVAARRRTGEVERLCAARPFLGVPTLLKDLGTAAAGLPSTMGSRLFGKIDWKVDSELVARMRKAGFVMFARSTSPEMGISPSTEALAYGGPTRNPWNLQHSAGGSSGGAAAALAARIVPIAHATDGAGSIRIPAACCGVVGLKPSRGLVPAGPLTGEAWGGLATEHVVSLSVRDSASVLDLIAGRDVGAPYAAPAYDGAADRVRAITAGRALTGLRFAVMTRTFDGEAVDAEVAAAVEQTAHTLAGLGHFVEPAAPKAGGDEIVRPLMTVIACGAAMTIDLHLSARGRPLQDGELEATTRGALEFGRSVSGPDYMKALARLHMLTRRVARFFEGDDVDPGFDVLLMPVLAQPPAPLGRWAMTNPDFIDYRLGPEGLIRYSPFTPLANMTGQPAISLPLSMSASGLPIGVQLVGRFGADAQLLEIAAQLEAAAPWAGRIAPFAASA